MRIVVALLFFCFLSISAFGAKPRKVEYPVLESAHYGVLVKALGETKCVKAYQSNKSFTPASVMKLITTATALEKLGPDFRYMTKLAYTGYIANGVLHGDLIIKGDGDPTLGSRYLYDKPCEFLDVWVREVAVLGIDSIAGAIISDASVFDKQVIPDKWIWEDIGNYYGAGCYGLSCFDNRYDLYFSETEIGEVAFVDSVCPNCQNLTFESHVLGADNSRDNAYIYGSPWHFQKQIYGTIPAGRNAFRIKGALPNPPLVLADLFKEHLETGGIPVSQTSNVLWEADTASLTGISIWFSPCLADIVKVTNKESNNLFAEHLLKSIVMFSSEPATVNRAVDSMMVLWASHGLKMNGVRIYDGSGMSRATLLTPDFVVGLIDYVSTTSYSDIFYESLAISGVDGTFKYFLDGTPLETRVHGKSGSMSGVRCYAGIVEKSQQERYSFCIMVNNFTASSSEVKKTIEAYLCDVLP